jgi:hypothetical protein
MGPLCNDDPFAGRILIYHKGREILPHLGAKTMTRKPVAKTVAEMWLKDLGISDATVNENGDISRGGRTLTRDTLCKAPEGKCKEFLAGWIGLPLLAVEINLFSKGE